MQEVRKPVVGYEGYYEVSNLGNVRSIERSLSKIQKKRGGGIFKYDYTVGGKILKQYHIGGYKRVSLTKDTVSKSYLLHRLVYCSFNLLPLEFKGFDKVICHINDISHDNRIENLYLGTQKQNIEDAKRNGKFRGGRIAGTGKWGKPTIQAIESRSKVTMDKANEIRSKYTNNDNLIEIGKIYGVSNATISRILSNKIWKV